MSIARIFAIGAICLSGAAASAQPFTQVDKIGDWNLLKNAAMQDGCLIERVMPDGKEVQIGLDPEGERAYLALFIKGTAGVEKDKISKVHFDLDGEKFSGDAVGIAEEGYEGGYVFFNNFNFAYDLAKKQTLTITAEGREPIKVDLTGTKDAMLAMAECQAAQTK